MNEKRWSEARRVLCVRLDTMGDVLMTTPAIRALRESAPGRRITLLTSRAGAEAAALVPVIDDVIVHDAAWVKTGAERASSERELALVDELRRRAFDAAVIFTVYTQSALPAATMCLLAGIPLRLAHARVKPYALLTDWVPDPEPEHTTRHEVRRQLDLVGAVGCATADERLALTVPESARRTTARLLAGMGLSTPWVCIHPGASASSRRYPPEGFAAAARELVASGIDVVFTGSSAEETLVESIRVAMGVPSVSLAGRLALDGLAALLERAALLISNNTGPAHVAAAVGTPVVDLYALTNPQHTPWRVRCRVLYEDVPCRFCYKSLCPEGHHRCLTGVAPDAVVAAAIDLLEHGDDERSGDAHRDETSCLLQDKMRASAGPSGKVG
jgi:lipopolysaccharide heptosyltransferase II